MEELVSSVQSSVIRDYMAESLSCYMAGAYRASVVLTFIALFDDIISKLGELGKVNKKAKNIHTEAQKKRAEQEVFETYLIDQLKSNNLLAQLDASFLEMLRTLRNKAAHPSGHHASAEEARFVFFEAVNRFLSRPILSTTQMADEILASLSYENVFPSRYIDVIEEVVKKETVNLHPEVYPYLVVKILEKASDKDTVTAKNSRFFLSGLARVGSEGALPALKKFVINGASHDKANQKAIISLLSANGALFLNLDDVTYQRLAVLIGDRIEKVEASVDHTAFSHPASMFLSLLEKASAAHVMQHLGVQYDAFIEKFAFSAYFSEGVMAFENAREKLIAVLCRRAGSADFNTANQFVKHVADIDKIMADEMTAEQCFQLLVNVLRAADIGAYSAIDLRNAHFGSTPKLRAKALAYSQEQSQAAEAVIVDFLNLDAATEAQEYLEYFASI